MDLKVEEAHKRRLAIQQALKYGNMGYLQAGKMLSIAIKSKDYKVLGYEKAEFYFYNEFQLKRSTAYNLIAVADTFLPVLEKSNKLDFCPDYTRLVRALPYVTSENAEEWVHKAITLPPEAFENELRAISKKTTTDECPHLEWRTIRVCRACGKKEIDD